MHTLTQSQSAVRIQFDIAAKINFACHQNSYAVLKQLRIENSSKADTLSNLTVTLKADPSFVKLKTWHIDRLARESCIDLTDRDIQLDGDFLLRNLETTRGHVRIEVRQGDDLLAEDNRTIELLAFNEWGGAGFMPELLAAFVTPNDPSVDTLLRSASNLLTKSNKNGAMEGYQSGSRQRVWELASAIYAAIANLHLTYSEPPASFEIDGQKIRMVSRLLSTQIGTCLDLAIVFASAFEQAGLNTIIVLPKGHALVGVWLQPEELSTVVIDEAETLRKRVQLQELILIETTCAASSTPVPFSKAIELGRLCIEPDRDEAFCAAVDVKRARMHRIGPLGLQSEAAPNATTDEAPIGTELCLEQAPVLADFDMEEQECLPETPQGRLQRWQQKLLDLTLRNPLLNHKTATTSLKIICPNPALLEDKLAAGFRISIEPFPQPSAQGQDQAIHRTRTGQLIAEEYAREALDKKQVLVDLSEAELAKRAVEIYRKAQTALQEGGSNTLFLALGFLLWKREDKEDKRFRAPLILLPVSLERASVRSGIKMIAHDDEPRFNTTLLEMLRQDFEISIKGLEGQLPQDASGIDVNLIWNTVRKAVKDAPGFEVVEEVVLGHFSFAKYLMWKDLVDRTEELRANPIVRHLLDTPREPYKSEVKFVDERNLDREFAPADLLVPSPTDASQMAAIATADRGKDFVIIGPPGTGKSQTITNLIAHLLGKGKSILFVSEKTAALEVVYRRLTDMGLDRFCLQLHSNKARKVDVLKQLNEAWDNGEQKTAEAWKTESENLRSLRDNLNNVVSSLHKRHPNGLTAHYAIGVKVRDEALAKRLNFTWTNTVRHDERHLNNLRSAVDKLAIQAKAIGGSIAKAALAMVSTGEWSPQWEGQVLNQAAALSASCLKTQSALDKLCDVIGFSISEKSLAKLDALGELCGLLAESYKKQSAFALEPNAQDRIEALEEAVTRLKKYAAGQSMLSCSYDPLCWRKLDGADLARQWKESEQYWFLKKFLVRRRITKALRDGGAQGKPNPEQDFKILEQLRAEGEAIDRLDRQLSTLRDWRGHTTDPDTVDALRLLAVKIRAAVNKLSDQPNEILAIKEKVRTILNDGNEFLATDGPVGRASAAFVAALAELSTTSSAFENIAGCNLREQFATTNHALPEMQRQCEALCASQTELRDWCAWRKRRAEAIDCDLLTLVQAIESGIVPTGEIRETFEAAYCAWWSSVVIGEDEVLRTFSSAEHNINIERFRQVDEQFQKITAQYVSSILCGNLPDKDDVRKSSQWGILRHEIQKKTRHKPLRQLIQEIPDVIRSLSPCFMMSPLSVAQYLSAGDAQFDVVIFDEASQITVWDAVGSIARGKQTIIAGDPKQMPPTNFFGRGTYESDDDVSSEGDLESILDELLGASIPQRTLNLHYRSRKESLIAFSNNKYYGNALITFPAPLSPDMGVRLVRPNGYYARGGARHNEGEARAIVQEIVRRLRHPDTAVRKQSIGVVTFNSEQQQLINDLMDEARSKHPEIEPAFSEDVLEPVFVKNLETVQGDERDVILFSVTYGPDQTGHVTMNFGPLNRTGGERRLNVAMTRARSEMIVFSTLKPEQIDLSRTSARAVMDLKHFLEYAERGPSVLGAFVGGSKGDFESPFEIAVARALTQKGWQVHPQVGISAYRIDIGIVHPDKPGAYLAGIECDGAMYHSSGYARERDKIRQGVLENLGWKLFRIWSTDWWNNQSKAIETMHQALIKELELSRECS